MQTTRRRTQKPKGLKSSTAFSLISLLCVILVFINLKVTNKHASFNFFQVDVRAEHLDNSVVVLESPEDKGQDAEIVQIEEKSRLPGEERDTKGKNVGGKGKVVGNSPKARVRQTDASESSQPWSHPSQITLNTKSPAARFRDFQRHGRKGKPIRRDKLRREQLEHHKKIAIQWAKLLVKTSFEVDLSKVCSPDYVQGEGQHDLSDAKHIRFSAILSPVRSCLRAVIAHSKPWNRETLSKQVIQSTVANRLGLNMQVPQFEKLMQEELSHVLDHEMLESAREIFMSAADKLDRYQEKDKRKEDAGSSPTQLSENIPLAPEPEPPSPDSDEIVYKHALKSWLHRGSSSSAMRRHSASFLYILNQHKEKGKKDELFFRPCSTQHTPLIMSKALFDLNPEEGSGPGSASTAINFTSTSNAGGGVVTHVARFPTEMLDLFPDEEEEFRYGSCALVGRGSIKRSFSSAIDANEAVIRVNHAPVKEFEHLVGSKTTFDFISLDHARDLAQRNNVPGDMDRLRNATMIVGESHIKDMIKDNILQDLLQNFNPRSYYQARTLVLSPQFSQGVEEVWKTMWNDLESIGFVTPEAASASASASAAASASFERHRPSPEFIATLFALQVCDHVHLYGFQPKLSKTYFGKEATQLNWPAVTYFNLMHVSIWPYSDAFRAITLHK